VLPQPSTFRLSRRLFVSGVAAVFALAFGELLVQVQGLFGARGIVPLAPLLDELAAGRHGSGDGTSRRCCGSAPVTARSPRGAGSASCSRAMAAAGILPCALLAACWRSTCRSRASACRSWASSGTSCCSRPGCSRSCGAGGVRPYGRSEREPSRVARWLVLWLLFRVMLLSGLLKLCSGDPSWSDGTALDFHYWTQPLPHRLSHYAQWWPGHALSLWIMFAVELGAPALLLVPVARRRCRQVAAAAVALLMAAIAATATTASSTC